jgi:hypothetical protein
MPTGKKKLLCQQDAADCDLLSNLGGSAGEPGQFIRKASRCDDGKSPTEIACERLVEQEDALDKGLGLLHWQDVR